MAPENTTAAAVQTPEPTAAAGQPAKRHISADHLKLALVARKARPGSRWAAMSNGAITADCRRHQPGSGYLIHQPPVLSPLMQGHMLRLLVRAHSQGRTEVLRTWRTSIAVLKAEFSAHVLRRQVSA